MQKSTKEDTTMNRQLGTIAALAEALKITIRHTSNLIKQGMPEAISEAKKWRKNQPKVTRIAATKYGDRWPTAAERLWMIHEIGAHGKRRAFPDWSEIAGKWENNRKNRINRSKNAELKYHRAWMVFEIKARKHRGNAATVFPDWGCLAADYLENKRRDHADAYARRRPAELKYKKKYRLRPEVKKAVAARNKKKKADNPAFRVRCNMAKRMSEMMKGVGLSKNSSILDFIGCSQDQLRDHIERQFAKWMTWKNYGTRWQVDHILPCASFDHTDPNQVRQCWHFTNLRPLCSKKNASKSDTITHPQMSLLLPAA
jgi:hypothetical protein